jgi:hypothetical protein
MNKPEYATLGQDQHAKNALNMHNALQKYEIRQKNK